MIDIRACVAEIVKAKAASDTAAFSILVHNVIRNYGQELLVNLARAIAPATPEEQAVVQWLQAKLVTMAEQIPTPTEGAKS